MNIHILPILNDNYAYVLTGNGQTAVIDPGAAEPIIKHLNKNNLTLDLIINTHHHGDHVAGNKELVGKYSCPIAAPEKEADTIGNVDITLNEDSDFKICEEQVQILETPGHTLGHICLYIPESKAVFTADTLFSLGCGRLFEGTPEQMWQSFQKILTLPDETKIYCGHEYTKSNAEFCLKVEPENIDLKQRYDDILKLREENAPTIPVTLETEKKTNAFLRAGSAARFAELRKMKDNA